MWYKKLTDHLFLMSLFTHFGFDVFYLSSTYTVDITQSFFPLYLIKAKDIKGFQMWGEKVFIGGENIEAIWNEFVVKERERGRAKTVYTAFTVQLQTMWNE